MYGALAACYDNELRDEFSRVCAVAAVEHLRRQGVNAPARLLDLACGTGLAAHHLQAAGYRVTGIDASEDMLAIARARPPLGQQPPRFVVGDICELGDTGTFSAALCFGDVLNHLVNDQDVLAMFMSVFSVLETGGWLLCDANTLDTYRSKMWNGDLPLSFRNGKRLRTRATFDEQLGLGRIECQVYQLGEDLEVHTLTERYHSPGSVQEWLGLAGFASIDWQPFNPLDLRATFPEIGTLKTLWIAQKT